MYRCYTVAQYEGTEPGQTEGLWFPPTVRRHAHLGQLETKSPLGMSVGEMMCVHPAIVWHPVHGVLQAFVLYVLCPSWTN